MAALYYVLLIVAAYSSVALFGHSLQPGLFFPFGVIDAGAWGLEGRTPLNTFNVDLADPAYTLWPNNKLLGDLLSAGQPPLWNPLQGAGEPLAAQYSTRVFSPYQIIESLSPVKTWDYFMLGRLWIAAMLSYLFLKELGLRGLAAFAGGAFYMLSGAFTWFIWLEQMLNVTMVLPALFLCARRVAGKRHPREIAWAALAFALALLGGQPETALYVIVSAGVYFLFCAFSLPRREACAALGRYFIAGVLGLCLAAPLLILFAEHLGLSFNLHPPGGGMGVADRTPPNWLSAIIFPTLYNLPRAHTVTPLNGLWDYVGGYVGATVTVLVFCGLRETRKPWRREYLFFSGLGLFMILKHLGIPPFLWIGHLPLFDQVWSYRWAGAVWVFGLCVAAALGLNALLESKSKPSREQLHLVSAVLMISFFLVLALSFYPHILPEQEGFFVPQTLLGAGIGLSSAVLAVVLAVRGRGTAEGVSALIALAVFELLFAIPRGYDAGDAYLKAIPWLMGLFVVWAVFTNRRGLAVAGGIAAIAALTVVDLKAEHGFPQRHDPFTPAPYVEFLKESPEWTRASGFGGVMFGNSAGALGVQDLHYIQALSIASYQNFADEHLQDARVLNVNRLWFTGVPFRHVTDQNPGNTLWFKDLAKQFGDTPFPPETAMQRVMEDIRNNLAAWSFMGVRYFLFPKWATFKTMPLVYDAEVRIYENPRAMPRAFMIHAFDLADGFREAQELAFSPGYDLRRRAVVESPVPDMETTAEPTPVEISAYGSRRVDLRVEAERAGMVVLTDNDYPGWKAAVDGRESPIQRINGVARGVWVEAGGHEITFTYEPRGWTIGLILSALAALTCLTLALIGKRTS